MAGRQQRRNPPFYQQTQKGMDDDGRVLRSGEGGCLQGEGKACPQGRFSAFFVKAQEIDDEKRRGLFLWQKYCNFIRKQSSTKNSSVLCRTRKERQIHLNGKDES